MKVFHFNPLMRFSSLMELLKWRAVCQPQTVAYRFLADGKTETGHLTYETLDRDARTIGGFLQSKGLCGERVMLIFPPGLEFLQAFWGCVYGGVIGVPLPPPLSKKSPSRLLAIMKDAQSKTIITTSLWSSRLKRQYGSSGIFDGLDWIVTENIPAGWQEKWASPSPNEDSLAYLQYTSGSTSTPKGVMVSHGNVLHNLAYMDAGIMYPPGSVSLTWLPHYHDMGLVNGLLQPVYEGIPGIVMPPLAFAQWPIRWLQAIGTYGVTHTGGPNFAYDLCVRKTTSAQRTNLNLRSWDVAYSGAEPVSAETLERFLQTFEPCGFKKHAFYPAYGLAEATLKVSGGVTKTGPVTCSVRASLLETHQVVECEPQEEDAKKLVGCGQVTLGTKAIIVDPESLCICSDNQVGEIWVSGPGVACGYWNRPMESQKIFSALIPGCTDGPFLRTGDLGFLRNGELFVTGRLHDLIIIRGKNYYPHDIERTVQQSHESMIPASGIAFSVEINHGPQLVIVQEIQRSHRQADLEAICGRVRQVVWEELTLRAHTVLLVKAGTIPKTSSGKLQRQRCKARFLDGGLEVIHRSALNPSAGDSLQKGHPPEEPLSTISGEETSEFHLSFLSFLAQVLEIDSSQLSLQRTLSSLGLDSLNALELRNALQKDFHIDLPLSYLLQGPTIQDLSEKVHTLLAQEHGHPCRSELPEKPPSKFYPLSYGQRALWFLHQMAPTSSALNLQFAAQLSSECHIPTLQKAFQHLVDRHAALRTNFRVDHGKPVQEVQSFQSVGFEIIDCVDWSEEQILAYLNEEGLRPFDLERGPLFRVNVLRKNDSEMIVHLVAHHMVMDLWSLVIFLEELDVVYPAECLGNPIRLSPLSLEYTDFVQWESTQLSTPASEACLQYWRNQLGGDLPVLHLPLDRPRPAIQTYTGRCHNFLISEALTQSIQSLAKTEGVTLYVVLLTAFQIFLARYTSQDDILVGSPSAGRLKSEFEPIIGYFVNPMVLRAHLSGPRTFKEMLSQVQQIVLQALDHQGYPFLRLVEILQPERDPSYSPIFQAMFVYEKPFRRKWKELTNFILGSVRGSMRIGGLKAQGVPLTSRGAQVDLTLTVGESGDALEASFQFNSDLFDVSTIERMSHHFQVLLKELVTEPDTNIWLLPLLSRTEREVQLEEWNQTWALFPTDQCIHEVFERQVDRSPHAVAVRHGHIQLTYEDVNVKANHLAHYLRQIGVGPDILVALYLDRSPDLIIGILAVLKAGGAYVPLDPDLPPARITFILQDAAPRALVTQQHLLDRLSSRISSEMDDWETIRKQSEIVCWDTMPSAWNEENRQNQKTPVGPHHLAYVMYTSGSTGVPKGVMVQHRSVVNYLFWALGAYAVLQADGAPLHSSIGTDLTVTSLFAPLLAGKTVDLLPEDRSLRTLARKLADVPNYSFTKITPSHLDLLNHWCSNTSLKGTRALIIGGEQLFGEDLQCWREQGASLRCINEYGPTETVVGCCFYEIRNDDRLLGPIPIGRPIANMQVYVLDRYRQPVPIGVVGEIYIGGIGVARGYLNRPELTAEKFIDHPFRSESGAKLYRSGDLGRFREDGNLEFVGRNDSQVKIRGFRVELGEIEQILKQHSLVREAVVVVDGEPVSNLAERTSRSDPPSRIKKRLYACVAMKISEEDGLHDSDPGDTGQRTLEIYLSQKLPQYMMPAVVLFDEFPRLENGKIDRHGLLDRIRTQSDGVSSEHYHANLIESLLINIWEQVLGINQVKPHDNFFRIGGHSLGAMQVLFRIKEIFDIELPPSSVFESPTVIALAKRIVEMKGGASISPPLLPKRTSDPHQLPLSFSQERVWFFDQLNPGQPTYNLPTAIRLKGSLHVDALKDSLLTVVNRHESLRTTIVTVEGTPVGKVNHNIPCLLTQRDLSDLEEHQRQAELRQLIERESLRPFTVSEGPLYRFTLVTLTPHDHLLIGVFHHVIMDGWSLSILYRELLTAYHAYSSGSGYILPNPVCQYADFAVWQREWFIGEMYEQQLTYWKQQLAGAPFISEFPTDHARPAIQTFRGRTFSFRFSSSLSRALTTLSREEGGTLFMTLFGGFATLLFRYSGQTDILVGSPIANRPRSEFEHLIGLFVNTLVLRADLSGNPSFQVLLRRIREMCLGAYSHQDLPFERLVDLLKPDRDLSHAPLFQVMFAFQSALDQERLSNITEPHLSVEIMDMDSRVSKFDLTMFMMEDAQGIKGMVEYNEDLFEKDTIVRMVAHLERLFQGIVANPEEPISTLPLLTDSERDQLLFEWNDTDEVLPDSRCLHHLFEEQVSRTPDSIALQCQNNSVTYEELNRRANHVARVLQEEGIKEESLVGVCLTRSVNLVAVILGILKAGGGYVPLDPIHPQSRLAFMIDDASLMCIITEDSLLPRLPVVSCPRITYESIQNRSFSDDADNLPVTIQANHLAYVLYTSGSSGTPKGVMVTHRNVTNYLSWCRRAYQIDKGHGSVLYTSIGFDLTVTSLFLPLIGGTCVWISSEDAGKETFADIFHGVSSTAPLSFIKSTPSYLEVLSRQSSFPRIAEKVQRLILGGEGLSAEQLRASRRLSPSCRVVNEYGPTETTVGCCTYEVPEDVPQTGPIPIGRPIANMRMYVLDAYRQPVPIGVPGELYVGGAGVTRGYLNRPDLTEERFIPDPFSQVPGSHLYKTGDFVRYRSDGNLEFLGRCDQQVKLGGYRIELEEVEISLRKHPDVREAVVSLYGEQSSDKHLVGYVILQPGKELLPIDLQSHLKHFLPAYMVPTTFVVLETFPLTVNGKVDRKALPLPKIPDPDEDLANEDREEDVIVSCIKRIWERVLGVSSIGIHDNFFELGGHSLLAVRVFAQIEKQLGKHLPLTTLFHHPTVAGLARVFRSSDGLVSQDSLFAIRPQQSEIPFFCVPGAGDSVLRLRVLADHLKSDQPFYGFQAKGLDGKESLRTSVEEMSVDYLRELRTIQPTGPYLLGGHSFGGVVAFDMAQRLIEEGETVALLALFDTCGPGYRDLFFHRGKLRKPARRHESRSAFTAKVSRHFKTLDQTDWKEQFRYFLVKGRARIAREIRMSLKEMREGMKKAFCQSLLSFNLPIPLSLRSFTALEVIAPQAILRYAPKVFPGKITIFRAGDHFRDPEFGWTGFVTGGIEIIPVPGTHASIIDNPQAKVLGEKLQDCIDRSIGEGPMLNGDSRSEQNFNEKGTCYVGGKAVESN